MKDNEASFTAKLQTTTVTGNGTVSACVIDMFSCIQNPTVRAQALTIMTSLHKNMLVREERRIQERTE